MPKLIRIRGLGEYRGDYLTYGAEKRELLGDYDRYQKFVKGCESVVRNDDRYRDYIARLKEGGLDHCAIMGNLPGDDPQLKIDMHHGPIFNLFDICDIVLRARLLRGFSDRTFTIADLVLAEHEANNIMIVMLSRQVHLGGVHNKKTTRGVFLDIRATWGRLDRFIDRWHDGMVREHRQYIRRYCEECRRARGQTLDQGLFDAAEQLKSFK